MPELPEVETIKSQLQKLIVGKKLSGKKIVGLRRRAKVLIIDFADGSSLLFHLKMTGQLIFNGVPSRHTRHIFKFNDGSSLVFNDIRKFGWFKKVKDSRVIEKSFGPEALKISLKELKVVLQKRLKTRIKPLLMDQKLIAGIGNIYSDEILFAAKVHPLRRAQTLKEKEIVLLWQNIQKILKAAVKYRGTSDRDYLDAFGQKGEYLSHLKVYGKEGERCSRCPGIIKRQKIGGRSAHFCSKCQKI